MRGNSENEPNQTLRSSDAPRCWSIRAVGDRTHPMLFAGYQTNPNYLGICWTFLQRHPLFLEIGRALQAQAATQKGKARPRYSNPSHCYALTN
jgi:hypothetical protein